MKKKMGVILSIFLVSIIILAGIIVCPRFTKSEPQTDTKSLSWMSKVDGEKSLSQLFIPGTHDTATVKVLLSPVSRCQNLTIKKQLECGVRFLDIRLTYDEGKLYLVHGVANCFNQEGLFNKLELDEVLNEMFSFLAENPSETVVFMFKEDRGSAGNAFFDSLYNNYISQELDNWYLENRIPTLNEVRGKSVLIRRNKIDTSKYTDLNSGINLDNFPEMGQKDTTDYKTADIISVKGENTNAEFLIQDLYKLKPQEKQTAFLKLRNADNSGWKINYLSTAALTTPQMAANKMNEFYKENNLDEKTGVVVFDFVTEELAELVYEKNY